MVTSHDKIRQFLDRVQDEPDSSLLHLMDLSPSLPCDPRSPPSVDDLGGVTLGDLRALVQPNEPTYSRSSRDPYHDAVVDLAYLMLDDPSETRERAVGLIHQILRWNPNHARAQNFLRLFGKIL